MDCETKGRKKRWRGKHCVPISALCKHPLTWSPKPNQKGPSAARSPWPADTAPKEAAPSSASEPQ